GPDAVERLAGRRRVLQGSLAAVAVLAVGGLVVTNLGTVPNPTIDPVAPSEAAPSDSPAVETAEPESEEPADAGPLPCKEGRASRCPSSATTSSPGAPAPPRGSPPGRPTTGGAACPGRTSTTHAWRSGATATCCSPSPRGKPPASTAPTVSGPSSLNHPPTN